METKLHTQKLFKIFSSVLKFIGFSSKMKNISSDEIPNTNANPCKDYLKKLKFAVFVALFGVLFGLSLNMFGQTVTTISTSGTWTVPAGVTSVTVSAYGAGGGSGYAKASSSDNASGGGGGGACAISTLTVSAGQVYTVTIGAGGSAGLSLVANGGAGGTTSFVGTGGTVSANGGGGGGGVAVTTGAAGTAGLGATTGTGTTIRAGGNGTTGFRTTANEVGGAGGGGAGNAGNGGNGSGATGMNSTGGAGGLGSPIGAPFAGAAGVGATLTAGTLAGVAGVAPGGGAAGAATYTTAAAGAIGGAGQVVLSYTLPGCTGSPTAGTAVTSATAISCSGTTNLSLTGSSTGSGLAYQWQQSFNGGAYANITGATAATYTTATLTAAGTYVFKCIITCTYSGLSATSAASATLTLTNTLCTCTAYPSCSAASAADDEILNVTVGTLNNTTTCASLAGGAGSVVAMYSNYSGIVAAPTLTQGSTVSGSVTIGFCSGTAYSTGFAVYIDYNQNGVFTDAGEMVYSPNATFTPAVAGTAYPFTFTVPVGATGGTTRMRIVDIEGGALPASTGTYSWGETEDYCVTIPIVPVISSFSPKSQCATGASNVTITGVNMASATSVTFNGVAGTIVSNTATSIVVTPPAGVATGNIVVTNSLGSATSVTPYVVLSFTAPTVANTGGGCSSTAISLTANGLAPGSGGVTLASASSKYLITPDLASFSTTKDITLEIWFKANAAGVIISEQGAAPLNAGWHNSQLEILASGEVKVSVWAGASSPVSIGTVSFGTWNHAVVRYNSATSKLDGLLNGVPSVPVTITRATPNSASPFFTNLYYGIGNVDASAITGGTGAYFDGQVDEFRVWNTALSTANIDSWMTREVTASHPNYANLVAYYKMNTGAMLVDSKTGTYPLTAVASPVSTVSSYYTYSWAGPSGATNPTASTLETQAGNTGSGAFPQTWTLTTTSPLGCTIPTTTTTNSIGTASTAPTSASVSPATYCLAPATITLTATGGSPGAGAVLTWTTGSCGGTVVGTGSPLTITAPSATTTYYAKYVSCVGTTLCVSTTVTLSPLVAPTAGTASPSTVCAGATVNLSAISAGNSINWYNAASGGTLLNGSPIASGGTFAVTPSISPTTTYYAQAISITAGTPTTTTFNYSGSIVNWTVPAGVSSITVGAKGAQGGSNGGTGGLGASTQGTFAVTSGQVLSILVGQQPPNNYSFAAGGGGTFVANGASYSTATPLIVAGGGGGSVSGTGQAGQILNVTTTGDGGGPLPGTSGNGATSTSCGGGGGGFYTSGGNDVSTSPSFIAYGGSGFRQGGAGGSGGISYSTGGFGGGASPNYYGSCNMEAGAGGGYSGGSAQNSGSLAYTGYGGGSFNLGTATTKNSGPNTGNGIVTINYKPLILNFVLSVLTPVTVTGN